MRAPEPPFLKNRFVRLRLKIVLLLLLFFYTAIRGRYRSRARVGFSVTKFGVAPGATA